MAFVDALLTENPQATVIMVDQHGQPGGHWNDDYLELASRNEILAYYERVMESFQRSGRVQYFPMCKFDDTTSRSFYSLVDIDRRYQVGSNAKIVDGTYMKVTVPQISDPTSAGRYEVAEGAEVVPLNALPSVALARDKYVIIGAGKSGMDAI